MRNGKYVSSRALPEFSLWDKLKAKRAAMSFDIEVTARCNLDCRHCYINLAAEDRSARKRELAVDEIETIAAEAVSIGAVWCLVTGGEPLLRQGFLRYLSGPAEKRTPRVTLHERDTDRREAHQVL